MTYTKPEANPIGSSHYLPTWPQNVTSSGQGLPRLELRDLQTRILRGEVNFTFFRVNDTITPEAIGYLGNRTWSRFGEAAAPTILDVIKATDSNAATIDLVLPVITNDFVNCILVVATKNVGPLAQVDGLGLSAGTMGNETNVLNGSDDAGFAYYKKGFIVDAAASGATLTVDLDGVEADEVNAVLIVIDQGDANANSIEQYTALSADISSTRDLGLPRRLSDRNSPLVVATYVALGATLGTITEDAAWTEADTVSTTTNTKILAAVVTPGQAVAIPAADATVVAGTTPVLSKAAGWLATGAQPDLGGDPWDYYVGLYRVHDTAGTVDLELIHTETFNSDADGAPIINNEGSALTNPPTLASGLVYAVATLTPTEQPDEEPTADLLQYTTSWTPGLDGFDPGYVAGTRGARTTEAIYDTLPATLSGSELTFPDDNCSPPWILGDARLVQRLIDQIND